MLNVSSTRMMSLYASASEAQAKRAPSRSTVVVASQVSRRALLGHREAGHFRLRSGRSGQSRPDGPEPSIWVIQMHSVSDVPQPDGSKARKIARQRSVHAMHPGVALFAEQAGNPEICRQSTRPQVLCSLRERVAGNDLARDHRGVLEQLFPRVRMQAINVLPPLRQPVVKRQKPAAASRSRRTSHSA